MEHPFHVFTDKGNTSVLLVNVYLRFVSKCRDRVPDSGTFNDIHTIEHVQS